MKILDATNKAWSRQINNFFKLTLKKRERKNSLYTNGAGTGGQQHAKRANLYTDLTLFMKMNGKWTKDPSVKSKNYELLDENR